MKKTVHTLNVGDQKYEDMEGEGSGSNTAATVVFYNEADRCPICLNCLLEKEVGFPENCNHVFCMSCILKWAETLASCPIDRKPFQAVFKLSALGSCIKVQVKRQSRKTNDEKNESSFKKQISCHENSKSCIRKTAIVTEDGLSAQSHNLTAIHRNSSCSETREKKNATKTDKLQRSNCTNQCFRNFFSNIFSSSSPTGESSYTHRIYCTELIEVNEISAVIRQKRQELELSWFRDTLPGIGRNDFITWNIETEVLPLISVLPRTILPANTISLENFGTSWKEYALAHTQGEEKKQTSGASNTRGSRRKPAATTPTRRSTRNTRAETVSQSQGSPVSNNSGCDAPDNNNPSVSVSSSAESEKQTRQAPKRKPVRRGRKAPLLKKKFQSSVPPPEKSSSGDSVDEEMAESDLAPVLEKEQQSDTESSNTCPVQTNAENKSANSLRSCSERIEASKGHNKNHDIEEAVKASYSECYTQDPPVLLGENQKPNPLPFSQVEKDTEKDEKDTEKDENTGTEDSVLCMENDTSKASSEKKSDLLENQDQISGPLESEVKTDTCADHPPHDSEGLGCEIEAPQPVSSPVGELPENAESVVNEEKIVETPIVEMIDHKDSTIKIEQPLESPSVDSSEGENKLTGYEKSVELSEVQLLQHAEIGDGEVKCGSSGNEDFSSAQDSENALLKNEFDNMKLDKCLEEKAESLGKHLTSTDLSDTHTREIPKHFSEDNNEMIPMECDSFCSDQNESEIEPSVSADSKQLNENCRERSSENIMPPSNLEDEKVETVSQPSESPVDTVDKAKRPRTRKSRFHSPSTTWSPNKDTVQEKKRSQSPSPKKETGKDSRKSPSPSPKKESARGRRKSRSQSPKKDNGRERRRSRSPKREHTREGKRSESLSPRRDTSRENRRSQSRVRDSSPREKSRSQSKERESDRDGQRRDRDRERRTKRWSRSRSHSRSPSRSRTKTKSSSFGRNDRDSYSPRWKEKWTGDGWRCPRGNDRYRKSDPEKQQNESSRKEKNDTHPEAEDLNSDKHRNDCPNWVTEKINSGPDPRTRNPGKLKDTHWEENRNENSGNSWNKNFGSGWMSNRGRGNRGRGGFAYTDQNENRNENSGNSWNKNFGSGWMSNRGRGNRGRGSFAYTDQSENRWQNRKPLSGNSNSSGNESFKFVEQQPYKRKSEQDVPFDTPADRSGWTSASSWAVRKTLPADVQNYYSRRGRNSSGPQSGWMRQEEETAEPDSNLKDQTNQQGDGSQLPVNMMPPPQVNVMQQQMSAQHQPMSIFPYPVGVHPPLMNIQHSPFNMHPQLPLHLHTGVPIMQVAAPSSVSQGLPPPPPPPPPSQQVSYVASQPEGKQLQGIPNASHVSNNMSTPVLPAPTAAPGNMGTVQGPGSGNTASSSHSKPSNAAVKLAESKVSVTVEASADSSKTDKKLQIQEKAAQEVKLAIKPFYQNKDITKEEYKEIVRKAVDKVCHSKSGEVNSTKVANLVRAYVDKYKHSRKGVQKKSLEEPVSAEKTTG